MALPVYYKPTISPPFITVAGVDLLLFATPPDGLNTLIIQGIICQNRSGGNADVTVQIQNQSDANYTDSYVISVANNEIKNLVDEIGVFGDFENKGIYLSPGKNIQLNSTAVVSGQVLAVIQNV